MSNCLLFALGRWIRRGGFVIVRKSRHGWWPHLLWSSDLKTFEEYQPITSNDGLLIPPPIYRGCVCSFTVPDDFDPRRPVAAKSIP